MGRGHWIAGGALAAAAATAVGGVLLHRGRVQAPAPARGRPADPGAPVVAEPAELVWAGPVSRAQSLGAEFPGVPVAHRTCTGDGSPSCGQIAEGWRGAD